MTHFLDVEFCSKNKFEKLVHLVDFIIRIYQDAQPPERQSCSDCWGGNIPVYCLTVQLTQASRYNQTSFGFWGGGGGLGEP